MALIPMLLYLAEKENQRREENLRNFVPTASPNSEQAVTRNSDMSNNATLDGALLHLLDTGHFSDVQFQVGVEGYCFNCHKAIVGGRSEVLAIAMEQRWTENDMANNLSPNKTVIRLPETNVQAFKVFLKYLYSDKIHLEADDGNNNDKLDLFFNVMSLSHMYQVEGLLNECDRQVTVKINVRTCWKIYKETRLIAPSLSEKSFKFLCDNIHEAAGKYEYLRWDGETVGRILSLDRSFISELNLLIALQKWLNFPAGPLEPPRKDTFSETLLRLIRFPSMNLATFSKVMKSKILSPSENRRLRRYITNSNPRRRNTTTYSHLPRFTDTFFFKLPMYTQTCKTNVCRTNWYSAEDNFMSLIDSQRAEFSIESNVPTTISGFTLHNVRKWDSEGNQCRFNQLITFQIYRGQSVLHKEKRSMIIGGQLYAGPLISFVLREPFQLNAGEVYEFHILYELLENDLDMEDENETYEYGVTWGALSPQKDLYCRRISHGIIFKINYNIEEEDEDEDEDDEVDHDSTPR